MAEGIDGATAGSSGQTNSSLNIGADIAAESIVPTERETAVFRSLMLDTFLTWPDPTIEWLSDRIARNGIPVSIGQIQGFNQFTGNFAEVTASSTTSSTSYADLAAGAGPTLSELGKGQYMLFYGARLQNTATQSSNYLSISVNGDAASDTDSAIFENTVANVATSVARGTVKDLDLASNSVTLKYRHSGGTTLTAQLRWLVALKIANL